MKDAELNADHRNAAPSRVSSLQADHPLFRELRTGLWHCTSPDEYRQIRADSFLKPNDGRVNRWGGAYACQQLGGVSLFDFKTHSEQRVLGELPKWGGFLQRARPVTIVLGIERNSLVGKLVPYPDNKEGTTGNVIPWVEVCHCGPIPLSSVTKHLLVCPVDYSRFHIIEGELSESRLIEVEDEFRDLVTVRDNERKRSDEEFMQTISAEMQKAKQIAKAVKESLNRKSTR
jgi:hypothetical protein